jgi:hypothetical protein
VHDLQRAVAVAQRAQPVGGVGQAVQVQPAGEQREDGDGEDGAHER